MIEVKDIVLLVFGALITAGLAFVGYLLKDLKNGFEKQLCKNEDAIEETKKDLAKFKETLPYTYVMRDDFLRAISSLDRKIDQVANEVTAIGKNVSKLVGGEKT